MIIGVDINNTKKEWGERFGMTHFVNPKEVGGDLVAHLVNMTKRGADQIGGADYTFDCTGNVKVMRQALEACHRGWGQSIIIGVAGAGQEIATRPFQLVTGRVWKGTAFGGARGRTDVPKIVDWYMDGKIEIDPMITHTHAAGRHQQGFRPDARGQEHQERGGLLIARPVGRNHRGSCGTSRRFATSQRMPLSQDSSVLPRILACRTRVSLPVDTSRTWMVNPRIRLEIFLTEPVMAISAPARRAMSTSHPPHLCSGAAFSVSAVNPDRSTSSYPHRAPQAGATPGSRGRAAAPLRRGGQEARRLCSRRSARSGRSPPSAPPLRQWSAQPRARAPRGRTEASTRDLLA